MVVQSSQIISDAVLYRIKWLDRRLTRRGEQIQLSIGYIRADHGFHMCGTHFMLFECRYMYIYCTYYSTYTYTSYTYTFTFTYTYTYTYVYIYMYTPLHIHIDIYIYMRNMYIIRWFGAEERDVEVSVVREALENGADANAREKEAASLARHIYRKICLHMICASTCRYTCILYTIQYNTIQYNTIQYNTIQYNTIQYNTIQYNTIHYTTLH